MEVPKSTPTSGLFLEMGILPVQFVTEMRQLMFLKKIIARDPGDLVKKVYLEMIKYPSVNNINKKAKNYGKKRNYHKKAKIRAKRPTSFQNNYLYIRTRVDCLMFVATP